jgi:hypothetical protein
VVYNLKDGGNQQVNRVPFEQRDHAISWAKVLDECNAREGRPRTYYTLESEIDVQIKIETLDWREK